MPMLYVDLVYRLRLVAPSTVHAPGRRRLYGLDPARLHPASSWPHDVVLGSNPYVGAGFGLGSRRDLPPAEAGGGGAAADGAHNRPR